MKILIAIPAYRCENQIIRVLASLEDDTLNRVFRVVIIDNISPDNTVSAALSFIQNHHYAHKFRVFQNQENYGLGGTHKIAFNMAGSLGCDTVVILHGDDQASGLEVQGLITVAENNPTAVAVLGARFMPDSILEGYSQLRTLGNRGLNLVYSLLFLRRTWDLGSGLNLFKMSELSDKEYIKFSDHFTFNMDLLLFYFTRKKKIIFHPITWREKDQKSNVKAFVVGWQSLKTALGWRWFGRKDTQAVDRKYSSNLLSSGVS